MAKTGRLTRTHTAGDYTRTRPFRPITVIRSSAKRKRRDRFPNLAASHAPSTSVRRTCRGARLATTPERAASDQWTARSPLATTILGARPFHAHGPFASNPRTGFPSAAPSREEVWCPAEDDFAKHSRGPSAAFATARKPYGPSTPLDALACASHQASLQEPSASRLSRASARIKRRRWIGGITRIESRAPQGRVARPAPTR